MLVRELVTKWGFDINTKPLDDMNKAIKTSSVQVAAVGAAVTAAAGALFGLAKFTADAGDEAIKMSQKLGISVESFQKLGFAAKLANIDSHEFTQSLNFLNRNMVEALQGNKETAGAFRTLGVSLKDATGKLLPADQVFRQISANFNKLPNGAMKAAVATKIFGRAGANLIPLLSKGNAELDEAAEKAQRYGIVLTEAQAQAAEVFNDTVTESIAVLSGLRNIIGNELIPVLTDAMREFIAFIDLNREDLVEGIRSVVNMLKSFLSITFKVLKQLAVSAKGLLRIFGGFDNVAKVLGIIAGLFAGGALLSAIGGVTTAVIGLAGAFTLANAAALLIPIAIGAAVVAIGLIIEDVVAFFQGRESVFGLVVEKFKAIGAGIAGFFRSIYDSIAGLIGGLSAIVSSVLDPIIMTIQKATSLVSGLASGALARVAGFLGLSAQPSNQAQASGASNNANISAPINITTGSNMTPQQQIGAVSSGISDGLAPLLRGAGRTFSTVEAY